MNRLNLGVIGLLLLPLLSCAQIWDSTGIVAKKAGVQLLGSGYKFTEGPAADHDGNVFFTDQPNNQIIRWDAGSRQMTLFSDDAGRSNGMSFDKEGHLLACADMKNELWSIDTVTGKPTILISQYQGKLLNGPNDLWVTPKGNVYFTDPFYKRDYWLRDTVSQQDRECLYYFDRSKDTLFRVDENFNRPNGLVGTPDGKELYVADLGAGKTYKYQTTEDGHLTDRQLFINMGSDGMTMDHLGNIYLSGKGVTVFDKKGEKIAHIPIEANWVGNICFGGKNHDILFITASTAIFALQMQVKGAGY